MISRSLIIYPRMYSKFMNIIMAIGGPVMTIPQIVTIWGSKSASGINIWTWGAYFVIAVMWLNYGIHHKDTPVILNSSFNVVTSTAVVLGVVMF